MYRGYYTRLGQIVQALFAYRSIALLFMVKTTNLLFSSNNEFAFFFDLARSPKMLYNHSIPSLQRIDEGNAHQIGA
jgi:hypothetical protein